MVKIVWCEVRWIRWLAELHQSAYTWNCSKRLGADLRLFPSSRILFRASLDGLRSPVHEQWQLFPNFEQLTSAHCLTILKVLTPSPFQVLSPSENTLTSHGLICANTFINFVFCSYFHDLQSFYNFARWQHWKPQVKDGADRNEVGYTELEQSYKWARNDIYI